MPTLTFNVSVEGETPEVGYNDFQQTVPDLTIQPGGSQWVEIPGFMNTKDVTLELVLNGVTVSNVGDAAEEVVVIDSGFEVSGSFKTSPTTADSGQSAKIMFLLQNNQPMGDPEETVAVTVDYEVRNGGVAINPDGTPA